MPLRLALDTCVVLAEINREDGRCGYLHDGLCRAANGEFELIVSTLVFAEIIKSDVPEFINHTYVRIIGTDVYVALLARELRSQVGLKVPDAIHLASSIWGESECLLTYDEDLLRLNGQHFAAPDRVRYPSRKITIRTCHPEAYFHRRLL